MHPSQNERRPGNEQGSPPSGHPSDLTIEKALTGAMAPEELAAFDLHVASCGECADCLEEARSNHAAFAAEVLPQTIDAVVRRGSASQRWRWVPGLGVPALGLRVAAAAGLAVVAIVALVPALVHEPERPAVPAAEVVEAADTEAGVKGGSLMRVYAKRGNQVFLVSEGEHLRRGDALRFVPDAAGFRYLLVLSMEQTGKVTPFFPYKGLFSSRLPIVPGSPLPGSIVLDESIGTETLWAVFSNEPVAVAQVRQWVASSGQDADAVEAASGARSVRVFKLTFVKEMP